MAKPGRVQHLRHVHVRMHARPLHLRVRRGLRLLDQQQRRHLDRLPVRSSRFRRAHRRARWEQMPGAVDTLTRFTIYCHTCVVTGKKYVGQSKRSMEQRWIHHTFNARHRRDTCAAFHAAIRKYGENAWTHEVLDVVYTRDAANAAERRWIEKLNCRSPHGYNLAAGGNASSHHPASIAKMSAVQRARAAIQTPEERRAPTMRMTAEARSERVRRGWASMTAGERSAIARSRWDLRSPEERSRVARRTAATRSPEQWTAAAIERERRRRERSAQDPMFTSIQALLESADRPPVLTTRTIATALGVAPVGRCMEVCIGYVMTRLGYRQRRRRHDGVKVRVYVSVNSK